MSLDVWKREFIELVEIISTGIVRFWKEDVWPLFSAISFFVLLAVPLLLLLLVLWYLDAIGWRAESGFYKIGGLAPPVATVWVSTQPLPDRPSFSISSFSDA